MKYQFWKATDELTRSAPPPFEFTEEEDLHHYLMMFDDHLEEDGVIILSPFYEWG